MSNQPSGPFHMYHRLKITNFVLVLFGCTGFFKRLHRRLGLGMPLLRYSQGPTEVSLIKSHSWQKRWNKGKCYIGGYIGLHSLMPTDDQSEV